MFWRQRKLIQPSVRNSFREITKMNVFLSFLETLIKQTSLGTRLCLQFSLDKSTHSIQKFYTRLRTFLSFYQISQSKFQPNAEQINKQTEEQRLPLYIKRNATVIKFICCNINIFYFYFSKVQFHIYLINFSFFKERVLVTMRVRMWVYALTQYNQKVCEKSPAQKRRVVSKD